MRTLEKHLIAMAQMREKITKDYRETQVGAAAIQRNHDGSLMHQPRGKARKRFAETANKHVHNLNPHENPDDYMYASILAIIPQMMKGHHVLNRHNANRTDRHDAKLDMIEFNDVLRTIIDINPDISEDTILSLVKSAMLSYGYGAHDINDGEKETRMTLIGMKHELAFESVLSWLPEGYEILTTTNDDDKHGADFKVLCPNGVILYIDVKATPESAERATQENSEFYARFHEQVPKNQLVLYSGFTREDFDSQHPWRPSNESVQRVYPELLTTLHDASVDTEKQMNLARMGKIVVGRHV